MAERPLILLSNDDGYRSRGISALRTALLEVADVVVCAPETEQSAASHALSLHRPLRLYRHDPGVFSVDGTPADCVYVALAAGDRSQCSHHEQDASACESILQDPILDPHLLSSVPEDGVVICATIATPHRRKPPPACHSCAATSNWPSRS